VSGRRKFVNLAIERAFRRKVLALQADGRASKAAARELLRPARRKSRADLIFLKAAGHQPCGVGTSGKLDVF
jgi:hypothetical protein